MDQTALERLLKELQGLDEPADTREITGHAHEPEGLTFNSANINNFGISDDAIDIRHGSNSELERLLGSLRPVAVETHPGIDTSTASIYPDYSDYPDNPNPSYEQTGPPASDDNVAPDIRKFTFAQALPVISRLAGDPDFIEQLQQLKSQQESVELSILDERNKAKADLEKQLKKAQEAGKESGIVHEVDRINKLLYAATTKIDKQSLVQWDKLAREQQGKLEMLGVPCFYVLKGLDPVAQERQRRVMETLVTLLHDS